MNSGLRGLKTEQFGVLVSNSHLKDGVFEHNHVALAVQLLDERLGQLLVALIVLFLQSLRQSLFESLFVRKTYTVDLAFRICRLYCILLHHVGHDVVRLEPHCDFSHAHVFEVLFSVIIMSLLLF